jgi:hypothetical protein
MRAVPIRSKPLTMLFALLALGLFAALPRATRADDLPVTFAGEVDSDGPLIIDPSSSDDPVTLPVYAYAGQSYFIERMPQTKSVTGITIGDFGQDQCSSSSPTARLYVYSRGNNDLNGPSAEIAYSNEIPLPATPGRLSFSFEWLQAGGSTLLMSKDKAYSFQVGVSGCSSFKQTTWAPLESKMETPNRTCITPMPFGQYGDISAKMAWHDATTTSPDPACMNFLLGLWPQEPDGWLVSIQPGNLSYPDMIQNIMDTDPDGDQEHYCDRGHWAGRNVSQVDVVMDGQLDGVCRWESYYPPGQETRYTWSTALPWRQETGAGPRLSYLKLDTVNWDNTLLQQYTPAMKFDRREAFLPEDARGVASIAPSGGDCSGDRNGLSNRSTVQLPGTDVRTLHDTRYADAGTDGCPATNQLRMDDLGPVGSQYPYLVGGQHPVVAATDDRLGDHLSLRGDASTIASDSSAIYDTPGWGNHVYGRVVQGSGGDLWLQYYFWYYYNNGMAAAGGDDHEGDWEGIQLHFPHPLAANPVPDSATYNEHAFRSVCTWDQVSLEDGHPVVYVSNGRHASYFTPSRMPSGFSSADGWLDATPDSTDADASTPSIIPHVEPISAYTPGWIRWPGRWGDSTGDLVGGGNSPTGPATFAMWSDPAGWDAFGVRGDHNSDVACPLPMGSSAKSGAQQQLRSTTPAAAGDGPVLKVRRVGNGRVRVTWSLSDSAPAEPARITLAVNSTSVVYPANMKQIDLRAGKRHGVVELQIPKVRGPYAVFGRILDRSGAWSTETRQAVPKG